MGKRLHSLFNLCTRMLLGCLLMHTLLEAQEVNAQNAQKVLVFRINQEINPGAARILHRALARAEAMHASLVVMEINSFGGQLDAADEMRRELLDEKIPTIAWVNDNAASAAALLAISCRKIYMHSGAKIGSASVVDQSGQIMPDKYQSYMRAIMRATASRNGRDSLIAEGMVTPNRHLPEVADSGRIIALTTNEAIQYHYCDGEADQLNEVLQLEHVPSAELVEYKSSWVDLVINWLTNPVVNSILLLLILGGIYFEFQHPGLGMPLFAGLIAAILYFAPLYLDGLAANWEILVFLAGIFLLVLEIFVVPGSFILGISGVVAMVAGLSLALVHNHNLDFQLVPLSTLAWAITRVMGSLVLVVLFALFFGGKLLQGSRGSRLVLASSQQKHAGYSAPALTRLGLLHQQGVAFTDLNPSGYVQLEGVEYDCISDGHFIRKGTPVQVLEIRGNYLVVTSLPASV